MKLTIPLISGLAAVFLALPAMGALPKEVIVDLFRAHPAQETLIVEGPITVIKPSRYGSLSGSQYEIRVAGSNVELRPIQGLTVRNKQRAQSAALIVSRSITVGPGFRPITITLDGARRTYAGEITVGANAQSKLVVRNKVKSQDYVLSVVGSETNPEFSPEMLKAQAVLTQTIVARYKQGDPLTDTTEKQAYLGLDYVRPQVRQAVDAVHGQILAYKGLPATIYYHSTCAGGTSSGERYFRLKAGGYPYLEPGICAFCEDSPFYIRKQVQIPAEQFRQAFGRNLPQITEVDEQHRPLNVRVGNHSTSGFQLWTEIGQKLGWDKVPGTRYDITARNDRSVLLGSSGAGHGIGLCQWGAHGQAKLGKKYEAILRYYFPGTSIQVMK